MALSPNKAFQYPTAGSCPHVFEDGVEGIVPNGVRQVWCNTACDMVVVDQRGIGAAVSVAASTMLPILPREIVSSTGTFLFLY